jgi:uncharacterized protein YoxC
MGSDMNHNNRRRGNPSPAFISRVQSEQCIDALWKVLQAVLQDNALAWLQSEGIVSRRELKRQSCHLVLQKMATLQDDLERKITQTNWGDKHKVAALRNAISEIARVSRHVESTLSNQPTAMASDRVSDVGSTSVAAAASVMNQHCQSDDLVLVAPEQDLWEVQIFHRMLDDAIMEFYGFSFWGCRHVIWHANGGGGRQPKKTEIRFPGGIVRQTARMDMYRGLDEDDIMNVDWVALFKKLPRFSSFACAHQEGLKDVDLTQDTSLYSKKNKVSLAT